MLFGTRSPSLGYCFSFASACALSALVLACSANEGGGGSGGTTASTGGNANTSGGTTNSMGGATSGGSLSGGASALSGGASSTSGGASSSGGARSTGGANTSGAGSTSGGANNTGGASSSGGSGGTTSGGSSGGGAAKGGTSSGGSSGGGAGTAGQASGGSAGAAAAAVRFVGRMDESDAKGPRFAWSGSGVVARFEGTQVAVTLSSGHYTVLVDGQLKPKLVASGSSQSLATGLAAGPHVVELYRRTEANQGESQFLGFNFGGGTLLSPPAAPARRIEVVGDSISCGYGIEGPNMSCPFSADTENHYETYAALSARALSAELVTVAWSGKGVVCNVGGEPANCSNPLPTYYERALPDRANSSWDFQKWQADAVVINLGTNDFSSAMDPTQQKFETGYTALVTKIRSKYPNAWILCTNGTMLTGTDLSTVRGYIRNVVSARNAAGDTKIKAFELNPQEAADGYGCDWHPSKATHVKMATQLTAALKSTLGW